MGQVKNNTKQDKVQGNVIEEQKALHVSTSTTIPSESQTVLAKQNLLWKNYGLNVVKTLQ